MEKEQIITRLKGLKQVKPTQEWKETTKNHLLGHLESSEKVFLEGFLLSFNKIFGQIKLVPIAIPALIIVLVGAGIFTHFYLAPSGEEIVEVSGEDFAQHQVPSMTDYLILAETKLAELTGPSEINPKEVREVVKILEKATDAVSLVPRDPVETAKVVDRLTSINRKVAELGQGEIKGTGIEELKEKTDVLAVKTTEVIEENIKNTTAELVGTLIKSWRRVSLTEEQEEILEEIKLDYNNGNYEQALERILTDL